MVKILSYTSTGELHVTIRGERYDYFGVSPYWYANLKHWIAHKRFGIALEKLKMFSDVGRFEELGGAER